MHLQTDRWRAPLRAVLGLLCVAPILLNSCSDSLLPALPRPSSEGFAAVVRDQLSAAYDRAAAHPDDAVAVGAFGKVLYAYTELQAAADCFERSHGLAPQVFEWAYLLGVAQSDLGRSEDALAAFEQAALIRPEDLATSLRIADLLEQSGDPAAAAGVLEPALQLRPASAAVHYRLGRLASAGAVSIAIEHFEAALASDPGYREAMYALARALQLEGRAEEAARQLSLYEAADPVIRRHYEDPLIDAIAAIRSASAQEVFNDGYAFQQSGDFERAIAMYENTLEIDPQYAQAHVNLVSIYGQLGDHDRAARHYELSIELNPSVSEAHYNYGVSRHFAGDFRSAAEAFEKALAINPQDASAHGNLATALEELGRPAEATEHYRLALEHDPSHPMANFHVGRQRAASGRLNEALLFLHKAIETETAGSALHCFVLALVYRQIGKLDRAREYGELALAKARAGGHAELAAQIVDELDP